MSTTGSISFFALPAGAGAGFLAPTLSGYGSIKLTSVQVEWVLEMKRLKLECRILGARTDFAWLKRFGSHFSSDKEILNSQESSLKGESSPEFVQQDEIPACNIWLNAPERYQARLHLMTATADEDRMPANRFSLLNSNDQSSAFLSVVRKSKTVVQAIQILRSASAQRSPYHANVQERLLKRFRS